MALRLRTVVGLTVPNLGGRRQQSLPDSTLCSEVGVVMAGGTQSPDAIAVCLLERGRTRSRRIVGFRRVRRFRIVASADRRASTARASSASRRTADEEEAP